MLFDVEFSVEIEIDVEALGVVQLPSQPVTELLVKWRGGDQAALQALPPDYRAAVVLCDIEGFSYEEIAATMGVKLGTVRSRIHRGRAQLRAALAHRDRDRRVRER